MKWKIKQKVSAMIKINIIAELITAIIYFSFVICYLMKNIFRGGGIPLSVSVAEQSTEINSKVNIVPEASLDLSVIIPVYNSSVMCIECLNSILCQKTAYSVEVIVIDDGSTDGLFEVLKEKGYLDKIKYISITNHGQGYARNRGIEVSRGKRLMFMDADDMMQEGAIDCLMQYKEDLIQCGFEFFGDRNGCVLHKEVETNNLNDILRINCFGEGYPWGKVYARHLFSDYGFPEYTFEDNNLSYLIVPQIKSYRYVKSALIRYRIHKDQETANVTKNRYGIRQVRVIKYLYDVSFKNYGNDFAIRNYLSTITIFNLTTVFYSRTRNDIGLLFEGFNEMKKFIRYNTNNFVFKNFKEKQFQKAVQKEDFIRFFNICRFL